MVTLDKTYFNNNPHFWEHQADPTRHHNTFKFITNNIYNPNRNYSEDEITNRLEIKQSTAAPSRLREAAPAH